MESSQTQMPQEAKLHFLDYWRIIRIRKAIIITVFLITAIIATAVTFMLPETYSSTAEIKIEPDTVSDIQNFSGQMPYANYDPYFIQTEFQIIQGQSVLGKVVESLNLDAAWGKKYFGGTTLKTTDAIEFLKHRISLSPVRNTKLIDITVYSDDKDQAAVLANAIAAAYRQYRWDQRNEQTRGGIEVLNKQLDEEAQQLQVFQTNVNTLRDKLGIHDTDPNSTYPSPTLSTVDLQNYNNRRIEDESTYMKQKKQLEELQALDPVKLRDVLPTVYPDAALSDLLSQLHEAERKFVSMTNDYSLANPDVVRIESMIAKLNTQVDDRVVGIVLGMDSQVKTVKAELDGITAAVEEAKQKDSQEASTSQPYWEAKRQLENMQELHKLLIAKVVQTKTDMVIPHSTMVTIPNPAEPGKAPVYPKKTLNIVLGLVVGLVVGVGLAFFIEYLDTSVKTIDEVERAFQAPVLGVIPQNVGSLVDEGPESRYAEAYRVLRTNILFSRKDDKLNTMVLVSAGAGEGKSTTTLNLATVFAQATQRVLVVDSDLRRPTLHKLLKVGNNIGLTNYLLKQNTLEESIQRTNVPMLDFMASGKLPSSSMGILSSGSMKDMISELKRRYDFIFFDSPPIMGVSDASILASEVDLVVQVIQYRRYPQQMTIRAKQLIEKVGGNFVGLVLNNINMSQDESYYYYTGYYNDYYSRNEAEPETAGPKGGVADDAGKTDIAQKY